MKSKQKETLGNFTVSPKTLLIYFFWRYQKNLVKAAKHDHKLSKLSSIKKHKY